MRDVARWYSLALTATLITGTYATQSFTLSDLQPIDGFSAPCTAAYNIPLTACSAKDFSDGHSCSTGCVAQLQNIQYKLNSACAGTRAVQNDLIGHFFNSDAVFFLCGDSTMSSTSDQSSSSESQTSRVAQTTTMATSSIQSSATERESTTELVESTSTTEQPSSTETAATSEPAINSSQTYVASALGTSGSSAATAGSSSGTNTATAASSSSTSRGSGSGGGGTPFDIDSGSTHTYVPLTIVISFVALIMQWRI